MNKRGKLEHLRGQLEALTDQLNEATWNASQAKKFRQEEEIVEVLRQMYPGVINRLRNLCQPIHSRFGSVYVCRVSLGFSLTSK